MLRLAKPYFRPGAGSVIFDQAGRVLTFERADLPGTWQFHQGGMYRDETPEATLWRELREETGLSTADFESVLPYPGWLSYAYSPNIKRNFDQYCLGQIHRWYFLGLRPDCPIDLARASDHEFTAWRWSTFEDLLTHANDLKMPVYEKLAEYFSSVILPSLTK